VRTGLAVVVLAMVAVILGARLASADATWTRARPVRYGIGALVGVATAVVTVSLALDVIPDNREGELVDAAALVAGGAVAVILLVRLCVRLLP